LDPEIIKGHRWSRGAAGRSNIELKGRDWGELAVLGARDRIYVEIPI
jgi:hypothetical protein